jgi:membrane-bound metal-dependent hydrolase YbcI (DUF457 family)
VDCPYYYFEAYDLEIDPGPQPDARRIAEQIAGAMRRAYESGRPQNVMLHTIRLGADLWRQYAVRFDPERGEVAVRVGPLVNTGQTPLPGSAPSPPLAGGKEGGLEARVQVGVPLVHTYDAENKVDIFSGPSFKFVRQRDQLYVQFLDWHRRWSHSLTLAAALGLLAAGISALVEFLGRGSLTHTPLWAGLVVGLGFAGHVLEDQLGFMGSNLLWPFTRRRAIGAQLLRSGDAIPNFLTVWTAVALILFNLDRFSAQPLLNPWLFLGLAVALPLVVLGGLYQWLRRRGKPETQESLRQRDIVAEAREVG